MLWTLALIFVAIWIILIIYDSIAELIDRILSIPLDRMDQEEKLRNNSSCKNICNSSKEPIC